MSDTAFAKLKRLKINRYRNIQPGTELRFADGTNVLLGKNGSGKTTLLNLLAMVVSGNFHPIRREEFALEFDLSYADRPETWSVVIENKKQEPRSGKRIERAEARSCYFHITHSGSDQFEVDTTDSALTLKTPNHPDFQHNYSSSQYGPFNDFGYSFINDLATLPINPSLNFSNLPQQIHRLDEARDWLRENIFSEESFLSTYISSKTITIEDLPKRVAPFDLFQKFISIAAKNKGLVTFTIESSDIPTLQNIVAALGYENGQAVFERQSGSSQSESFGHPHFHFTMRDGTSIRLQDLSFGEQRLFAYYYYLACSPQVVIADELTNGMHHEMVRGCIQAIGQRQAFLATQNPLLLDHLEFASIDAARESFILCSKELIDSTERMTFRQMSEDEGREFFGHYGAEQQHVNEILRCLGLW